MIRKLFIFIFVLNLGLRAGEIIVKGKIIDKETRAPLPAYVMVEGIDKGCTADEDGEFSLAMPKDGRRIIIYLLGYQKKALEVKGEEFLTIELEPEPMRSYEVIVTADSQVSGEAPQKTVTMKMMDVYNIPGTAADPLYAASILPGINSMPDASSMIIRGGAPDEVAYFFDGIKIEHPFQSETLHESYFSIFDNQTIDKFNVSTSGYSPKFGDALSGVMDITAKDLAYKTDVGMGLSILGFNGFLSLPIKNYGSFIGSLEKSSSNLMTKMNNKEGFSFDTDNVFSKLNMKLSSLSNLRLINLFDRYQYSEDSGFKMDAKNNILGLYLSSIPTKNILTNFVLSRVSSKVTSLVSDMSRKEIEDNVIQGRFDLFWDLDAHYIEFGGDIQSRKVDLSEEEKYQTKANKFGLYFNDKLRVASNLFVNFGGRINYIDLGQKFYFDPRVSTAYFLSKFDILRFSIGIYHQYGDLFELEKTSILKPKRAFHYSLSYDKINDKTNLRLTIYNKSYRNLFLYENERITNNGYGYARGGELYIKKNKNWYDLIFVYNLLKSKRKEKDTKALVRSPYEIDHSLTGIFIIKWKDISLGIRYSYARGLAYTPLIGKKWDDEERIYVPTWGDPYSCRYPSYQRMDINGKKIFNIRDHMVAIYFGVMNVLNNKNILRYEYGNDYSQQRNVYSLFSRTFFLGFYVFF